ncbi:MAG: phosphoribosylformylglycinamidine synthase I, partial [Sphingobacteriaceae bacterium]
YYADEQTLNTLESNGQILYKYVTGTDGANDFNPNGAIRNIAGICNDKRNVFGMMPHPERACDPLLGNMDGRKVFQQLGLLN